MGSSGKGNMISFQALCSSGQFEMYKDTLGGDMIAKAAVHVLGRLLEAKISTDELLAKLKGSSGWQGEPLQLLQAIAACEKCYKVSLDVITTHFSDCSKHSLMLAEDLEARLVTFMDEEFEVFTQFCGINEIAKAATKVSITLQTAEVNLDALKQGCPEIMTILKGNDACKVLGALSLFDVADFSINLLDVSLAQVL